MKVLENEDKSFSRIFKGQNIEHMLMIVTCCKMRPIIYSTTILGLDNLLQYMIVV